MRGPRGRPAPIVNAMSDPLLWHRLQFAFTIVYHYLFPAAHDGPRAAHRAAQGDRRCAPATPRWDDGRALLDPHLRHQLRGRASSPASRWSSSSARTGRGSRGIAGGVIGQTLAMEGMFAFFLESTFLGAAPVRRAAARPRAGTSSPRSRCSSAAGSPATSSSRRTRSCSTRSGHAVGADGKLQLADFWAFLFNPWAISQYAHTMVGAVVTGVVRDGGGGRLLRARRACTRSRRGSSCASASRRPRRSVLVAFPTGDCRQARGEAPAGRARRDGGAIRERPAWPSSRSSASRTSGAPARQPDRGARHAELPRLRLVRSNVKGLNEFPEDEWPDNIELLYYAFHVMVGLGTLFIAHRWRSRRCLLAGPARTRAAAALGADARVSVPLHRDHRRLDDGGARPAAVARLRPDAHGGRRESACTRARRSSR